MFFFFIPLLGIVAAVLGGGVFALAFAFIRKPVAGPNRFGTASPTRSVGQALGRAFVRALDFSGRGNRWDFWSLALFVAITGLLFVAATIGALLYSIETELGPTRLEQIVIVAVAGVGWVMIAVACLSMAVRRLHDSNRSGWWLLLLLVFGYFILLYWFLQPSTRDTEETAAVF